MKIWTQLPVALLAVVIATSAMAGVIIKNKAPQREGNLQVMYLVGATQGRTPLLARGQSTEVQARHLVPTRLVWVKKNGDRSVKQLNRLAREKCAVRTSRVQPSVVLSFDRQGKMSSCSHPLTARA